MTGQREAAWPDPVVIHTDEQGRRWLRVDRGTWAPLLASDAVWPGDRDTEIRQAAERLHGVGAYAGTVHHPHGRVSVTGLLLRLLVVGEVIDPREVGPAQAVVLILPNGLAVPVPVTST